MNSPRIATRYFALAAALLALPGCGSGVDAVPVSGRVTLDGQPLADAHVSFEPVRSDATASSIGSYAVTDEQGVYHLRLVTTDMPGAMPGAHIVRITTARAEDPSREDSPISAERVPPHYRRGIELQVPPAGTDQAHLTLTSQPSPASRS